jgi:hypothetical protein
MYTYTFFSDTIPSNLRLIIFKARTLMAKRGNMGDEEEE